jgi:tetratricopeptide (TPR) repeat protein
MSARVWYSNKRWIALAALALAVAAWGVVFARQSDRRKAQRHIDAGIEYAHNRQAGQAEREWREAARLAPNNPLVWELLGELFLNSEQWSKGAEAFQQLRRVAPNKPSVYARLAACTLRTGDEQGAFRYAQEELKRNPEDNASLAILAFLSEMKDDTEKQIEYLQRLLKHAPNDPEFLHSLIMAYYKKGQPAEMKPIVERLLAVRPDDPVAHAMRAMARIETEGTPEALAQSEADLLKALQIQPLYPFAHFYLGRIYLRQKRFDRAVAQLERAEQLSPHQMNVPFELATAYSRTNQRAKAAAARRRFETLRQETTQVSVLQKRCSLNKDDFDSHLALGRLTLRRGDYRQASYYLQRAVALRPNSVEAKKAYDQMLAQLQSRTGGGYATKTP